MTELLKITSHLTEAYKRARLSALQESPLAFGSTYGDEMQMSERDWQKRVAAMNEKRAIGYLAMEGHKPCGLIRGTLDQDNSRCAEIGSMWVAPTHRRSGLASRLLIAVQGWAIALGVTELRLTVTNTNGAALALYVSHGFQATGKTEPYPNDVALFEVELSKCLL
jgi:ribosomal protein S18 acetylase RimI-like enzyme